MTIQDLEFVAQLTDLRTYLADQLEKFESGNYRIFAGGGEMLDDTPNWTRSLKNRLATVDKAIAAYRERGG